MAKTVRLPNGITVVCDERPGTGLVAMQLYIKKGGVHERPEESGLTNLAQEACFGGTTTRSRDQIAEEIEGKGGQLRGYATGATNTFSSIVASAQHAEDTFAILADVLRHPAFDPDEIENTKAELKMVLSQQMQSPGKRAGKKFLDVAFTGQGLAQDPMGTPELLDSYTVAQVKAKHAELLSNPQDIVISLAGDIDAARAAKLVEKNFGDIPAQAAPSVQPKPVFIGGDSREAAEYKQLSVQFGFSPKLAKKSDADAARILATYLGAGLSSPLFVEVREKRGLAYSVGSQYNKNNNTFTVGAGVTAGKAGLFFSTVIDVIGKLAREGIDSDSLAQTCERILRGRVAAAESADGAASVQAGDVLVHGGYISDKELEARLKQVTPEDIQRLCIDMLRDGNYALGAVGPQETMPSEQQMKAMIQAQVKDLVAPPVVPEHASTVATFAGAAEKAPAAKAEIPKITVLSNGMTVMTVERPGLLSVGAWVGVGSDNEILEKDNGITHMLEHLPFKGTASYLPGQIDKRIEGGLAGGLNAYTSKDRTCYYFYNLQSKALEEVMGICGEMVFSATIDHVEFNGRPKINPDGTVGKEDGERDVVIQELQRSKDNPANRNGDLIFSVMYPDQSCGRTTLGTEDTLRGMTVGQIKTYRDSFYVPNNVTFAAIGEIKHEDFVAIVEKKYGAMPSGQVAGLPTPVYKGGVLYTELANVGLCDVYFAAQGVSNTDPEMAAYDAFAYILGGGRSSRLHKEVINRQQLSPEIGASTWGYRNGGVFLIHSVVESGNMRQLTKTVYAEVRKLAKDITQAELDKAKIAIKTQLLLRYETNNAACDQYACNVQDFGRIVTPGEILAEVEKLTVDDIKRVAAKVLASAPSLSAIVPVGTDPALLPKHEEVMALRDGKAPPKPQQAPKP